MEVTQANTAELLRHRAVVARKWGMILNEAALRWKGEKDASAKLAFEFSRTQYFLEALLEHRFVEVCGASRAAANGGENAEYEPIYDDVRSGKIGVAELLKKFKTRPLVDVTDYIRELYKTNQVTDMLTAKVLDLFVIYEEDAIEAIEQLPTTATA